MKRDELIKNHTVFPRSFLREVAVTLSYPSIEGKKMGEGVNSFFDECFKIQTNVPSEESFGPSKINTIEQNLSFSFDFDSCSLVVDASKDYISFADTVYPKTRPLAEFAETVAHGFGVLSMRKDNVWVFPTSNPEEIVNEGLKLIISPDMLEKIPEISKVSNSGSWCLSTECAPIFKDENEIGVKGLIRLILEYAENDGLACHVVLEAKTTGNVDYANFRDKLIRLNAVLYNMFIRSVSDKVLELMREDN